MKKIYHLIALSLLLLFACNQQNEQKHKAAKNYVNKFSDKNIQKITEAKYNKNTDLLYSYFDNKNPTYRKEAAMAFASVQDTTAIKHLANLLNDKEIKVRIAAAFALGQIGNETGAEILYLQLQREKNDLVKKVFLEAIGKCGNKQDLQKIIDLKIDYKHDDLMAGKALALSRFSIRGLIDRKALKEFFSILSAEKTSESIKYYASIALSRSQTSINNSYLQNIITLYKQSSI